MASNQPPMSSNTACDIYHPGTPLPQPPDGPTAPPDLAGLSVYMEGRFRNIKPEAGTARIYDHIMHVGATVDIRCDMTGFSTASSDTVYVPNAYVGSGTPPQGGVVYKVVFIERVGHGGSLAE